MLFRGGASGPDRQARSNNVASSAQKRRYQFIPGDGYDKHKHLHVFLTQLAVEVLLVAIGKLRNKTNTSAVVEVKTTRAIDSQNSDNSSFLQRIEVADKQLTQVGQVQCIRRR